jgi:hypothetical protein
LVGTALPARAPTDDELRRARIQPVLLISVEGLQALDLSNYASARGDATLAALVTEDSPAIMGFCYDVTFNCDFAAGRKQLAYRNQLGNGRGTLGGIAAFDEGLDTGLKRLAGGGKRNPAFLSRDPSNNCAPIFPHQYLRVNTIFEVVKAHGGRTI